jgi:hypothetical protein
MEGAASVSLWEASPMRAAPLALAGRVRVLLRQGGCYRYTDRQPAGRAEEPRKRGIFTPS